MRISGPGSRVVAPTLATSCAALPPEGAVSAWGGPALKPLPPTLATSFAAPHPCLGRASAAAGCLGFTLLELLVVVAIIALGSAGVVFAMRDGAQAQLEQEGQRLSMLLEAARAQSRSSGTPVRWVSDAEGFHFEGLKPGTLPERWLSDGTSAPVNLRVTLGPEPLIGKQSIVLTSNKGSSARSLMIGTDGLRPFTILANDTVTP